MQVGPYTLRPHQVAMVEGARDAIRQGRRRILIRAPTGAGKTPTSCKIMELAAAKGKHCLFLASGRQLIYQKSRKLTECGIQHAVLMAGEDYVTGHQNTVSSKDTLWSRSFKKSRVPIPSADVVIVDEAHTATAESWQSIYEQFPNAVLVGFTATPALGNGKPLPGWDALINGGTYADLIASGYLVPAKVYAPFTVDMAGVDINRANGEYVLSQMADRYADKTLVGDILKCWHKYAGGRLTGFFASSVEASVGAAAEFNRAGVAASHMDADTPQEERESIFARARSGEIKVITNFGVLRIGVDIPEIECIQLAVSMNSLNSYLQTVGRGFRPCTFPDGRVKTECVIIDHGGNVHKHGWPTEDHEWSLSDVRTVQERDDEKAEREKKPREPLCCPHCGAMRESGPTCLNCGFAHKKTGIKVRTVGGDLVPLKRKDVKKQKAQSDAQKCWLNCMSIGFYRKMTVGQVKWIFKDKFGDWPPADVKPMPPLSKQGMKVSDLYPNWGRSPQSDTPEPHHKGLFNE